MAIKVFENVIVPERNDAEYEAVFIGADAAETVILPAAILTITGKLTDIFSDTVIRNNVNVFNANGGSIDVSGKFIWKLDPSDHVIYATTEPKKLHKRRLTIRVTYARTGGASAGELNHVVDYYVEAMEDVP